MFMSRLLTPQEVMERLSMSQGKVYQLIRKGVIPSVFDQGRIMVPEDDLNEMLYQQLEHWEGNKPALREGFLVLSGGRAGRREG
jgi:excisionase family DNA binding protein